MGKAKMFKITSIDSFPNVYQNPHFTNTKLKDHEGKERELAGKWRSEVFKNDNPIVLELACGKGDYALALARKYPHKNFIGIDSKGARLFTGSKTALDEGLSNVVFVRMKIENILNFFAAGEVDEIWITFPDPFPKLGDAKRRLSAPKFLERYKQVSKPGAILNFKTDDLPLHLFTEEMAREFSPEVIYCKQDIYSGPLDFEELEIKTYYEKKHLAIGRTINYIRFRL
ncbi:MAG TPA: tRNA (guanosine(46)-N7)-methyltransferase TrmB [Chitinophagales bacterium]|nr:tRNA (guanosine(46)-N7)-methyltransferase TrmB [Chitinophagales bacterium]